MKTIKIKTSVIESAAKAAHTTPEGYLSDIRSISLGRRVAARFEKIEGEYSVFLCP